MTDTITSHHEHYGDPLDENSSPSTTRIYVQNLNGICWDTEGGRWPYICDVMSGIHVDIACFSEINTNTNKYPIRTKMEQICQRQFHHSRLIMSSSSQQTVHDFKPGGTAILACNEVTSHIKSHTRDRMGRWASLCLSTDTNRSIRIISAYQVCHGPSKGTTTAAAQQQAALISEQCAATSDVRLRPRQAFIRDLISFIRQIQAADEDVILVGDFNEDISDPESGMGALAAQCGLADVFAVRLGSPHIPATYYRGKRRLDFALITPSLLPHIKSAGYDPFGYRIPSDHRGMYLDFATEALFKQQTPPLAPAIRRDFSSKTPGVVNQYVTAKMQYLTDHNFFPRLQQLMTHEFPNHDLAESLDRDFHRAALHAARKCSRKKRHPWSPQLAKIWATLHYFRLAKSQLTTSANLSPAIQRLQDKWQHLPQAPPDTISAINEGYNAALRQLKEVRLKAQELRDEYLAQKVALYSALDQKGKAKAVQRLIRAEAQHQIYKKIQYLKNQNTGPMGLNKIRIPKQAPITDTEHMKSLPDSDEFWETITIPRQIETILLQRNRHHFGQARETPFATPPLQLDVGYKADGCMAEMILQGKARYPNVSAVAQILIQHLQRRSTTIMEGTITPKQIIAKLRKWKEETTTSPSGLHLGHYHCLWRAPQMVEGDSPESYDQVKLHQEQLLQATADLLNYAIKFGYTYNRWTKIVNVMIQKDAGNPRVHRLRIIHIYEADYNLLLAVKWRQALHHAEAHKLLNDGLYGSRKGRSAHDPVLIEVLQNEIYRMSMKSGINLDLDATSCYDRILPNVAAISSRRMGMSPSIVMVNSNTLEQAKYHLKTNLGVSDGYYTHCPSHPIFGTGQGSGNSPTIWCFVCSALFDAFESHAHGASFHSYDGKVKTKIHMTGFVDDCTQRVNDFAKIEQPDMNTLVLMMTSDAQLWNNLLWASGGALEQSKCSFHLIQSDWNNDGHPFLKGGLYSPPIRLNDGRRTNDIFQKSNYESHKTLGCYVNPAHLHHKAYQTIASKNVQFARLLETNYFTRSESWIFYTSFYLPSMTYTLPMSPLTFQQCSALDARMLRVLLPKCGYNRNMSSAIRYAPPHLGGAGFRHLYYEQGALLLQHVFKHLNSPHTTIGSLLLTSISWTQAFLGTSKPFLTDIHQKLPPIGPSLLMDLRAFLIVINASIQLTNFPISCTLRSNDRFIMDIALNQNRWTARQLTQINSCRRYLQSQTLADITNLAGTRLLTHVTTGQNMPPWHTIKAQAFNQQRPGVAAWRTWRKFLSLISTRDQLLHQPLGPWIVHHNQCRHWPRYVYDPSTHRLYSHFHASLYQEHEALDAQYFNPITNANPTHARGYPTATTILLDRLRPCLQYITPSLPTPIYIPATSTYNSSWEAELMVGTRNLEPMNYITQHLRLGQVIMCSDGSATKHQGSFGFVVATTQGRRLVKGRGPAPGANVNSFRSEAYGVLAAMLWLQQMSRHSSPLQRPLPKIVHYLDNKSVISRVDRERNDRYYSPNSQLQPDQDVIQEITAVLSTIPWHVELTWVRGHQDDDAEHHRLTLPAQLNCEADTEAAAHESNIGPTCKVTPLPHTPCRITIDDKTITSRLKQHATTAATTPALRKYMTQKFHWQESTLSLIDWDSHSEIIRKYKDQRVTLVKHLFNISPTGSIAHRNDPTLSHQCPACGIHQEDNDHVLLCPARSRQLWRTATLARVQHLDSRGYDPFLTDILQDGLRRYFLSTEPPHTAQYPDRYNLMIQDQNTIGWDQVFKARWSKHWNKEQDAFRTRTSLQGGKKAEPQWTTAIGRLLVDGWFDVWKIRNEERHGRDLEQQKAVRLQHLTARLLDLYSYKTKVCPSDAHLFHDSVDDHLHHHPALNQLEDWITMNTEAIRASAALAEKMGIHRNRRITEYLTGNPAIHTSQQASLAAGSLAG